MRRHGKDNGGAARSDGFTGRDRRRVARALVVAREVSLYRRLEGVLLVAEGVPVADAARRVRVADRSLQRWVAAYLRARDPLVLTDRPRSGRPRVAAGLTPERLTAVLAADPRALGYRATTWTAPLLAHHLRAREGLALSERT